MVMELPTPGSDEAIEQGCKCPRMDNHYGKGRPTGGRVLFIWSSECRLHWPEDEEASDGC